MKETGGPEENHRTVESQWQTLTLVKQDIDTKQIKWKKNNNKFHTIGTAAKSNACRRIVERGTIDH